MLISRRNSWLVLAVAVVALGGCGDSKEEQQRLNQLAVQRLAEMEASKSPEQRALEANQRAEKETEMALKQAAFSRLIGATRMARDRMKNPRSFELVSALYVRQTDCACIVYRGTNSFNAVVTESAAIGPQGQFADWNKNCAGLPGIDWTTQVRHAL